MSQVLIITRGGDIMKTDFDQVLHQVRHQVKYGVWDQVGVQLCDQVWTHLWYPVVDLVEDQIRRSYED
jgi:hypothetical protein